MSVKLVNESTPTSGTSKGQEMRKEAPAGLGGKGPSEVAVKAIMGSPTPKSGSGSPASILVKGGERNSLRVTKNRDTEHPKGFPVLWNLSSVQQIPSDKTAELVGQVVDKVLETEGSKAMLPAPNPSRLDREADKTGLVKPNDETDGFVMISPRKDYPVTEETRLVFDVVYNGDES